MDTDKLKEESYSQIAEVTPFLFLCGASALKPEKLASLGVTLVINCTIVTPNLDVEGMECVRLAVEDTRTARLGDHFDWCADKIKQTTDKGGKTLVHCTAGVSRSPTLCMAFLMKHQRMTLKEAVCHVRSKRRYIWPNVGFFEQLIDYEKSLFQGESTISIVSSALGPIPDVFAEQASKMVAGLALARKH